MYPCASWVRGSRIESSCASSTVVRGSPSRIHDRVFEPFQRLGDRAGVDGVGLGLAVARGFVEAMHGALTPEETPAGA